MRFLVVILSLFCTYLNAQDSTYYRVIGGLLNETAADIEIVEPDSIYMILGTTGSNEPLQSEFYLVKTDSTLNPIWTSHFGSNYADYAEAMMSHPDGGFLLLGYTRGYDQSNYDVLLVKVDENGEQEWTKTYGGEDWDFGREIIAHPDGGFLICGETYSFGLGQNDAYLIHIDEEGEEIWSSVFGSPDNDYAVDLCIAENDDGQYIAMTGSSNGFSYFDEYQAALFRVDLEGNLLDYAFYGFGGHFGEAIIPKDDKVVLCGYHISEENGKQGFVTEISGNNYTEWFSSFGYGEDQGFNDLFFFDDNYYLTGYEFAGGAGGGDCYVFQGNIVASYISGTTFGESNYDEGRRIIKDGDHTLVLGTTKEDIAANTDILAIKLNFGSFSINTDSISNQSVFDEAVDITEFETLSELNIYPNPCSRSFKIDTPEQVNINELSILDLNGRKIQDVTFKYPNHYSVNLSDGVYLIQINLDSGTTILKRLVVKN